MNGSLDAAAVALWAPIIAGFAMVIVAWLNQHVPRVTAAQTADAAFRDQLIEERNALSKELADCHARRYAHENELLRLKGAAERCDTTGCPVRALMDMQT